MKRHLVLRAMYTSIQLTLPAAIRKAAKLEPGDYLSIELRDNGEIVLKKEPK